MGVRQFPLPDTILKGVKSMTQRVFKMDNKKDVKDLFNILPDEVTKVKVSDIHRSLQLYSNTGMIEYIRAINIDWCGLEEVCRPVDYSQYVGKYGVFSDYPDFSNPILSRLIEVKPDGYMYPYKASGDKYNYFRPLTNKEKANLA
jgi:hypothetical protein